MKICSGGIKICVTTFTGVPNLFTSESIKFVESFPRNLFCCSMAFNKLNVNFNEFRGFVSLLSRNFRLF